VEKIGDLSPRSESVSRASLSDSALVALARSGNAHAFEQLVRRHQVSVFRIALGVLGDRRDAEDATQEAFLQAWRGLPRFRSQSAFSTWIYRIVTNRCFNLRRARRPSQALLWDQESEEPGPGDAAEARDRLIVLRAAILELTPEQRAAFVLRHLEGRAYEEIVEILGISLAAVKSRLHRARLELAIALGEWK
jgi:RNA polymerase sigma-70 factor, ECF subfamily